MDRRTFLGTITAATVLGSRMSWAAENHKLDEVGVQLYSVRDLMKQDFEGTLAKVAGIGYREVEFAGLFDDPAQDVRKMLDRNGLTAPSAHIPYKTIESDFPKALETSHTLGQSYIVCPFIDEEMRTPDGWKRITDTFNRVAQDSKKALAALGVPALVLDHQGKAGSIDLFQPLSRTLSARARQRHDKGWGDDRGWQWNHRFQENLCRLKSWHQALLRRAR